MPLRLAFSLLHSSQRAGHCFIRQFLKNSLTVLFLFCGRIICLRVLDVPATAEAATESIWGIRLWFSFKCFRCKQPHCLGDQVVIHNSHYAGTGGLVGFELPGSGDGRSCLTTISDTRCILWLGNIYNFSRSCIGCCDEVYGSKY